MSTIRFHKDEKGKEWMEVLGVDHGNPKGLQVLKKNKDKVLARVPGHTGWYAIGMTKYYSPSLIIYERVGRDQVNSLKEFEYTRETRKKVHEEAFEFFEESKNHE